MRKLLALALLMLGITPAFAQNYQSGASAAVNYTFPAVSSAVATSGIAVSPVNPSKHAVQVNTTGSPGSCTYNLEGSLDGSSWTVIINAQVCTTSGTTTWDTNGKAVRFVRVNFTALTASTTATAFYLGIR